jgi:hypothetical protein
MLLTYIRVVLFIGLRRGWHGLLSVYLSQVNVSGHCSPARCIECFTHASFSAKDIIGRLQVFSADKTAKMARMPTLQLSLVQLVS